MESENFYECIVEGMAYAMMQPVPVGKGGGPGKGGPANLRRARPPATKRPARSAARRSPVEEASQAEASHEEPR